MTQKTNNVSVATQEEVLGSVSLETHCVSMLLGLWVEIQYGHLWKIQLAVREELFMEVLLIPPKPHFNHNKASKDRKDSLKELQVLQSYILILVLCQDIITYLTFCYKASSEVSAVGLQVLSPSMLGWRNSTVKSGAGSL